MANATPFESEEYWTARYRDATKRRSELFDWYSITYTLVKPLLIPFLSTLIDDAPSKQAAGSPFMVDLGCGNSPFLVDAAEDVLTSTSNAAELSTSPQSTALQFVGIDFSPVVIEQQRELLQQKGYNRNLSSNVIQRIQFEVADCRYLCSSLATTVTNYAIPESSVSIVIDKATLDAMDCGDSEAHSASIVQNAFSILRGKGYFVSFTCRPVARRLQTIRDAMKAVGVDVEPVQVQSLQNDPISPSHMLVYQRQQH